MKIKEKGAEAWRKRSGGADALPHPSRWGADRRVSQLPTTSTLLTRPLSLSHPFLSLSAAASSLIALFSLSLPAHSRA